jgi:hypothetical protein
MCPFVPRSRSDSGPVPVSRAELTGHSTSDKARLLRGADRCDGAALGAQRCRRNFYKKDRYSHSSLLPFCTVEPQPIPGARPQTAKAIEAAITLVQRHAYVGETPAQPLRICR